MAPKEPTRQQLSSRLSYSQDIPPFLQKLKNRIAGVPDEDGEEEYEYDGSGRPPIPQRPAIPTRPEDDPGSEDEEDKDERPQVVVLKEGKHLTEREAENVRRKEKGLRPLDEPVFSDDPDEATSKTASTPRAKVQSSKLSFSSSKAAPKASKGKRKAVGGLEDGEDDPTSKKVAMKRAKKSSKALLSFSDDA